MKLVLDYGGNNGHNNNGDNGHNVEAEVAQGDDDDDDIGDDEISFVLQYFRPKPAFLSLLNQNANTGLHYVHQRHCQQQQPKQLDRSGRKVPTGRNNKDSVTLVNVSYFEHNKTIRLTFLLMYYAHNHQQQLQQQPQQYFPIPIRCQFEITLGSGDSERNRTNDSRQEQAVSPNQKEELPPKEHSRTSLENKSRRTCQRSRRSWTISCVQCDLEYLKDGKIKDICDSLSLSSKSSSKSAGVQTISLFAAISNLLLSLNKLLDKHDDDGDVDGDETTTKEEENFFPSIFERVRLLLLSEPQQHEHEQQEQHFEESPQTQLQENELGRHLQRTSFKGRTSEAAAAPASLVVKPPLRAKNYPFQPPLQQQQPAAVLSVLDLQIFLLRIAALSKNSSTVCCIPPSLPIFSKLTTTAIPKCLLGITNHLDLMPLLLHSMASIQNKTEKKNREHQQSNQTTQQQQQSKPTQQRQQQSGSKPTNSPLPTAKFSKDQEVLLIYLLALPWTTKGTMTCTTKLLATTRNDPQPRRSNRIRRTEAVAKSMSTATAPPSKTRPNLEASSAAKRSMEALTKKPKRNVEAAATTKTSTGSNDTPSSKNDMNSSPLHPKTTTYTLNLENSLGDPSPKFTKLAMELRQSCSGGCSGGDINSDGTIRVYHGTSIDNAWSILNYGLLNLSNTRHSRNGAMLGSGVYLTTSYDVAYFFATKHTNSLTKSISPMVWNLSPSCLRILQLEHGIQQPSEHNDLIVTGYAVIEANILPPPPSPSSSKSRPSTRSQHGVFDGGDGKDDTIYTRRDGKYYVVSDSNCIRINKIHITFHISKKMSMKAMIRPFITMIVVAVVAIIYHKFFGSGQHQDEYARYRGMY